ncbi:PepSY domain-containing protein [Streptosporangium sp. NPDC048047]|uniref:PepSY domain-containing protein n=1 Tax=Streptosporangium sp. NPDC048047 TaxID=3155748 RepID=UPI0034434E63
MRKPMIIVAGLTLAGLVAGGGAALADGIQADPASPSQSAAPGTGSGDGTEALRKPAVPAEQAQRTALSKVSGGWVVSTELETEGDAASWEVEVADGKGAVQEVVVDAATGGITSTAAADQDDDDKDDAQEKNGQDDD